MVLNNQRVIEEIKKETKETHGDRSKNTKVQNLGNAGKAFPRGEFIEIQAYIRKQKSQKP